MKSESNEFQLPDYNHIVQTPLPGKLIQAGHAASQVASRYRFSSYQERRAEETLRRQLADLSLFTSFLSTLDIKTGNLFSDPGAWTGVTWGLIEAFIQWQLKSGYAIHSINIHLSTIKTYTRLAMQSGTISPEEYAMIMAVQGFSEKEKQRIDGRRTRKRIGNKKEFSILVTNDQASALKSRPADAQGRRDKVMLCLLLDHGLRVGELSALSVEDVNIEAGQLRFYRPKVGKHQIHQLSIDAKNALAEYKNYGDIPESGFLLRKSLKDGSLGSPGLSGRGISKRVALIGIEIGVPGLSPHDCRHYWATSAARYGTDPFTLQEAGGWSSLAMPRRYIQDNEIANKGIKLPGETS